jgi:hypothetical protein
MLYQLQTLYLVLLAGKCCAIAKFAACNFLFDYMNNTYNDTWPYKNTDTWCLKGERWKDIPGFEGSFQASNLGRIQSLDRLVPHVRLYEQFVKGRILKQQAKRNVNQFMDDEMISLQVTFCIEGVLQYLNVRRLVYMAFKGKLNFESDKLSVINIDGNGYNNNLSNLALHTLAKKQQRMIRKGRINFSYLVNPQKLIFANWA